MEVKWVWHGYFNEHQISLCKSSLLLHKSKSRKELDIVSCLLKCFYILILHTYIMALSLIVSALISCFRFRLGLKSAFLDCPRERVWNYGKIGTMECLAEEGYSITYKWRIWLSRGPPMKACSSEINRGCMHVVQCMVCEKMVADTNKVVALAFLLC